MRSCGATIVPHGGGRRSGLKRHQHVRRKPLDFSSEGGFSGKRGGEDAWAPSSALTSPRDRRGGQSGEAPLIGVTQPRAAGERRMVNHEGFRASCATSIQGKADFVAKRPRVMQFRIEGERRRKFPEGDFNISFRLKPPPSAWRGGEWMPRKEKWSTTSIHFLNKKERNVWTF